MIVYKLAINSTNLPLVRLKVGVAEHLVEHLLVPLYGRSRQVGHQVNIHLTAYINSVM